MYQWLCVYYVFLIHWPKGKMRTEACFYSDKIEENYEINGVKGHNLNEIFIDKVGALYE